MVACFVYQRAKIKNQPKASEILYKLYTKRKKRMKYKESEKESKNKHILIKNEVRKNIHSYKWPAQNLEIYIYSQTSCQREAL